MKKLVLLITAISTLHFGAVAQKKEKQKLSKADKEFLSKAADGIYAKLETSRGDIYAILDHKETPITVSNYVGLAEGTIKNTAKPEGTPYYDGLKFHRIIPKFMIQGGCPNGNGSGDPGYKFPDELDAGSEAGKKGYLRGTFAMANAGPNTNGSQFFIMHNDYNLPYSYNIFGRVVKGIEVVDSIALTARGANDLPNVDQTIRHITILRKGKEAETFNAATVFESEKTNAPKRAEEKAKAKLELAKGAVDKKSASMKKTETGLFYTIEKEGEGVNPKPSDQVTVHYTGRFMDGTKFDSSVDRGQPATFGLGQVIKGWTEGLQLVKPGGKIKLLIPPALGYGEQGYPGAIPPSSWLEFDIELIKVN